METQHTHGNDGYNIDGFKPALFGFIWLFLALFRIRTTSTGVLLIIIKEISLQHNVSFFVY